MTGTPHTARIRVREPFPAVEVTLLAMCAGSVALGFADPDRAPLHVARTAGLAAVPVLLTIRSFAAPSLSARRGRRAPLWVPALAVASAVAIQAAGGAGGLVTALGFLAIGAGSLEAGQRRTLPWAAALALAVLVPGWLGIAAAAPITAQVIFALGLLLCAVVPGHALTRERSAHDRTRSRLRAMEDEAGGLAHETHIEAGQRGSSYGAAEHDRDLRAIARELQEDMERACAVLVSATGALAATVYRPSADGFEHRLAAVAMAGETKHVVAEVGAREGIFGAAFKAGSPVFLKSVHNEDPRIVHRVDASELGGVLAMPLTDAERSWGVVVLDMVDADALDSVGRELAGNIADFVARLITRAVDLTSVKGGMREKDAFYEACREVSRHVRIDAITEAVVRSAGQFVHMDACAVALCDESGERMRVVAHSGFDPEPSDAPFFVTPSEGLLAQAVRHTTAIDRPDVASADRPPLLFGSAVGPTFDLSSLLVLPIVAPGGGLPLGAMVAARRTAPAFEPQDPERLQVLLHQVGAAISNGRLFAEHESRGVTDGMTGLPNHRRFQEVLSSKLAASGRTRLKTSLLLMDIDKFKNVNDTYGHPMGDEVIKRLSRLLADTVRDGTDLAARYGGEEFCLVLDDTDAEGARILADRIREAFKEEVFVFSDGGKPISFRCSVSIGISTHPDHATDQQQLIDLADQALYQSKEGGRDRVTCWKDVARSAPGERTPTRTTRPGATVF